MAHRGASICSHTTSQKIFDVRARIITIFLRCTMDITTFICRAARRRHAI